MERNFITEYAPVGAKPAVAPGERQQRPYPRAFLICWTLELFYLFSRISLSLGVSYKTELFAAYIHSGIFIF
jgi:hypothetical protein